jgi:hypothetical protein
MTLGRIHGGNMSVPNTGKRPSLETLEERAVPASLGVLSRFAQVAIPPSVPLTSQANLTSMEVNHTSDMSPAPAYSTPAPVATTPTTVTPIVVSEANFAESTSAQMRTTSINKFNPSLGQLTRVEIIAEGDIRADAALENLSNISAQLKTHLRGTMQFQIQGLSPTLSANFERVETANVTAFDGSADLQGSSAAQFAIRTSGQFQTLSLTDETSLALFTGNGSLQVTSLTDADACNCGPGNVMSAIETATAGRVRVVYHYTPETELGSLAGYVYHDVNRDGTFNSTDRMIPGVQMTLTGTDLMGNAISRTTNTASNGWFVFNRLPAGNYTITQTQPANYDQGVNRVGTAGGVVVGDTITGIALSGGQSATNYSFGETRNTTTPPPITNPPTDPPFFSKIRFTGRFGGWL